MRLQALQVATQPHLLDASHASIQELLMHMLFVELAFYSSLLHVRIDLLWPQLRLGGLHMCMPARARFSSNGAQHRHGQHRLETSWSGARQAVYWGCSAATLANKVL